MLSRDAAPRRTPTRAARDARSIATWLKEVCALSEQDKQAAANEAIVRELQDATGMVDL